MLLQAKQAEWAWDDALSMLRLLRSGRAADSTFDSPMRISRVSGAQERTSALLELLRSRQPGGELYNEQLRLATLRGCEQVMERWEQMIHFRRQSRMCATCMSLWKRLRRQRKRAAVFAAKHNRSRLGQFLLLYRSVVLIALSKKRRLARTQQLRQDNLLGASLTAWRSWKDDRRCLELRRMYAARKSCRFGLYGKARACFGAWQQTTHDGYSLRVRGLKLEQRTRPSMMRVAFVAWQGQWVAAARQRQSMFKAQHTINKLLLQTLLHAFEWWSDLALRMRMANVACAHAITGRGTKHMKMILAGWRLDANEGKQRRRIERKVRTTTWRSCIACVKVFRSWRQCVAQRLHLGHITRKVMSKVCHARAYWTYNCWTASARRTKELRQGFERVISVRLHGRVLSSFCHWNSRAKNSVRTKRVLRRVIFRMMKKCLCEALNGWQDHVKETRHFRLVCTRVVRRMLKGCIVKCMNSWAETVSVNLSLKRRVVAFLSNRGAVQIMRVWKSHTQEQNLFKGKCRKIIMMMQGNCMVNCLETWASTTKEQIQLKRKCRKVILMLQGNCLVNCFNLWHKVVAESQRLSQMISGVVKRIQQMPMARALAKWSTMTAEANQHKNILRRACMKMFQKVLADCFQKWAAESQQAHEHMILLRRAAMKMFQKALANCFQKWVEIQREAAEHKAIMRRACVKMFQKSLVSSFQTWAAAVQEVQETRAKLTRILLRMKSMTLAGCWDSWRQYVAEIKGDEASISENLSLVSPVAEVLNKWIDDNVDEEKWRSSSNTVRIAKGFFNWASNLWWRRELIVQHERFVVLLQQRQSKELHAKWQHVMKSPHPVHRTASPSSNHLANIVRNSMSDGSSRHHTPSRNDPAGGGRSKMSSRTNMSRTSHRIPSVSSVASVYNTPMKVIDAHEDEQFYTPGKTPGKDTTRVFRPSSLRQF